MGCFHIFNFLIVTCSLVQGVILVVFSWMRGWMLLSTENEIARLTDYSLGGFGLALGIIVFCIMFFLRYYVFTKENSNMLTIYAVVLTVFFILQIILGSLAFVAIKNINYSEVAQKVVGDIFNNKEKKEIVDNIQQGFECCGINGPNFWATPPPSCYEYEIIDGILYTEGCAQVFKNLIVFNIRAIAIVSMVFAVLDLVGAVVTCILQRRNETTLRPPEMTDRTPLVSN